MPARDQHIDGSPAGGDAVIPWRVPVLAVTLFAGGLFGHDHGVICGALSVPTSESRQALSCPASFSSQADAAEIMEGANSALGYNFAVK
ncbi:MAG: hypothetical protein ACYC7B_02910 [Burkholderiales bacterium]